MKQEVREYILTHDDCKHIHKMVWADEAYLTEYNGVRHKITGHHTLQEVMHLVWQIKKRVNIREK